MPHMRVNAPDIAVHLGGRVWGLQGCVGVRGARLVEWEEGCVCMRVSQCVRLSVTTWLYPAEHYEAFS